MKEAGILLPIASLPGSNGIGTFGSDAFKFIDYLVEAGQKVWQILPLSIPDSYNSPYASVSSYAINHYLIDLNELVEMNLLDKSDIKEFTETKEIDYSMVIKYRDNVFMKAFKSFDENDLSFQKFIDNEKGWLDDYALFMSVNSYLESDLSNWEDEFRLKDEEFINNYKMLFSGNINYYKFLQYIAYSQYFKLKQYVNSKGIEIYGDIPFYSSYNSVEVWTKSEVFLLDDNLYMISSSGVPPDYFSKTGQNWMTPVYNKDYLVKTNYQFFIDKLKHLDRLYDRLRLDHFLGFDRYFIIPINKEPKDGVYVEGFGDELFSELAKHNLRVKLYAEDLGNKRDEANELLDKYNIPRMNVLQFSLDGNPNNPHLTKNHLENSVTYTGTHDNETTKGFIDNLNDNTLKVIKDELGIKELSVDSIINGALTSSAKLVIIPIQDYLEEDNNYRTNTPGTTTNNWVYKLKSSDLSKELNKKIYNATKISKRL